VRVGAHTAGTSRLAIPVGRQTFAVPAHPTTMGKLPMSLLPPTPPASQVPSFFPTVSLRRLRHISTGYLILLTFLLVIYPCSSASISEVKVVTTGTCESNGYTRIVDGDMCKAAATAAGFAVTAYYGGYRNVVDGCTIDKGTSFVDLFLNQPGTCSTSAPLFGTLQYCDCSKSANKCLCDARGSTFRETTCTDSPSGWGSKNGRTCAEYKSKKWCKPDGNYGAGWYSGAGSFSDWANSAGVDATQACCACGAGIKTYVPETFAMLGASKAPPHLHFIFHPFPPPP
jgi:hypothetical protein